MTVSKMLTGKDLPMTTQEYIYWFQYLNVKAEKETEIQKAESKKAGKKQGPASQEFKRTMGQQT